MPTDVPANLRAAQVLLIAGRFDDAKGRAEKVLAIDPKNIEAHIIKGNALGGLREFKGALKEIEQAIQTDPTRSAGYAHLGALQFAQGDAAQAEAAFKRAVATDPASAPARLALANLYWSTGRLRDAEVEMKQASSLEPENLLPMRALAMLYLGSNRLSEAEAPLKSLAAQSQGFEAKIMLADYYANTRRLPEARAIYEQVAATREGMATARLRLASLGLMEGDRPSAYRLIDDILAKDAKNVEALVARAQLLSEDGRTNEALASARSAVGADPNAPLAQYVLGRILVSLHQVEDAESAFKATLQNSPGFAPASVELARLAMTAGRYRDAIRYSQAAIDRVPGYSEAYLLIARAEIANGNPAGAEAPIKRVVANLPTLPAVQAELGRLLLAKGDVAGAEAVFSRVLAKEPLQLAALEGMVLVDVKQKRKEAARKRIDAAVAAAPKNGELQLMAARLYASSLEDIAAAEVAVRRVLSLDANNLPAYALLAQLHARAGNLPVAVAEFEKLAERQPKSVAIQTAIGLLNHLQNKQDAAKLAYERALALDPAAPVAANNLAQLYIDRNENIDVALTLAQTAKSGLPTSHEVDDTLGWTYYKKGLAGQAIASLKSAQAAQPENPIYLYHLGAAYALNKDKANARQSLEKALKLQPTFAGADDAKKILASLN